MSYVLIDNIGECAILIIQIENIICDVIITNIDIEPTIFIYIRDSQP